MSDLELGPERRDAAFAEHRSMILRYTAGERTNHWLVAMAFVLAALSGLALFHPALFGLSGLFGGGPWTRILHPFIGLLMVLAFLPLALRLGSENRMQPRDWLWLRQYRDVVNNREDRLPEVGRYNAGQKLVFYSIVLCLAGLLLSGLVIWRAYFSLYFPVAVVRLASVVHALCAAGADLHHHRPHLCSNLGEGFGPGDDSRQGDTGVGLEASSGLVPRDHDPCSEFSTPLRLKLSPSDQFHASGFPILPLSSRGAPHACAR